MENKPTPENTDAKQLNIMLPEELMERIYLFCDERGINI
jgi:hypothetical protein